MTLIIREKLDLKSVIFSKYALQNTCVCIINPAFTTYSCRKFIITHEMLASFISQYKAM